MSVAQVRIFEPGHGFIQIGDTGIDVLVCDSTVFRTRFGGDESLERFWKNIALAK